MSNAPQTPPVCVWEKTFDSIAERPRDVLKWYFGLTDEGPLTFPQIAAKWSVTGNRIVDIYKKGIAELERKNADLLKILKTYREQCIAAKFDTDVEEEV